MFLLNNTHEAGIRKKHGIFRPKLGFKLFGF